MYVYIYIYIYISVAIWLKPFWFKSYGPPRLAWNLAMQMAMPKKLEMARTLMMAVVEAKGSRQVVAAVASALLRAGSEEADQDGRSKYTEQAMQKLELHEQLSSVVEEVYGPGLGIGATCRRLRDNGYKDVANSVSCIHRERKMAAHPAGGLASRLKSALTQIATNDMQNVNEEKVRQDLGQLERNGEFEACHDMQNDYEEKVRHPLGQLERSGDVETCSDMQNVYGEEVRHPLGQLETSGDVETCLDMQNIKGEEVRQEHGHLDSKEEDGGDLDHALILQKLEEMRSDMGRYLQTGKYKQEEEEG